MLCALLRSSNVDYRGMGARKRTKHDLRYALYGSCAVDISVYSKRITSFRSMRHFRTDRHRGRLLSQRYFVLLFIICCALPTVICNWSSAGDGSACRSCFQSSTAPRELVKVVRDILSANTARGAPFRCLPVRLRYECRLMSFHSVSAAARTISESMSAW